MAFWSQAENFASFLNFMAVMDWTLLGAAPLRRASHGCKIRLVKIQKNCIKNHKEVKL